MNINFNMKKFSHVVALVWCYFLLQSEGTNVALPANCGKSIKLNTSSSVTLTYRNENGSVDDCSYVFTQDDVTRQICVTVVTPSSDIDCNLRIQWHTGAETFAFYSHQLYWCGMFDYSPVCMPVFSMGVFLRGLHTLPRGARYSMKFYVERTDSIPWSNTIQNHAMSWNRSLMISKLHWNIFIAATIIGLIISGFAVYVTVRFFKRKVPSDSVITDLDVELTQISQETTLQDVPHAIKNENITQMLPWKPPRYVSETHPHDGIENSHLLQRD